MCMESVAFGCSSNTLRMHLPADTCMQPNSRENLSATANKRRRFCEIPDRSTVNENKVNLRSQKFSSRVRSRKGKKRK